MTNQELFDKVVAHARTQREKSINEEGTCLYRGPRGLKCFIGALIPDDKYTPKLEGKSAGGPTVGETWGLNLEVPGQKDLAYLLQKIHDLRPIVDWEDEFRCLATNFNLTYTQP